MSQVYQEPNPAEIKCYCDENQKDPLLVQPTFYPVFALISNHCCAKSNESSK